MLTFGVNQCWNTMYALCPYPYVCTMSLCMTVLFPHSTVTDQMKPLSIICFNDHVEQMHAKEDRDFEIEYQVQSFIADSYDLKHYHCFISSLGSDPTVPQSALSTE